MFDQELQITDGDKRQPMVTELMESQRLPMVFEFWMVELARDMLRLGSYFRAASIMLQIPGAAEYTWADDDEEEDNETFDMIGNAGRNELLNVLADCFKRLGVTDLIKQVPAGDYSRTELSGKWEELLDRREKLKNGLLSIVAGALDDVVILPRMHEINKAGEQPWWQEWRTAT